MIQITAQRLRTYAGYGGDTDGIFRSKPIGFGELSVDEYSYLLNTIELLLDEYQLIEKQLAAPSFAQKWEAKAAAACDSSETVLLLKQVAMLPAFDASEAAGFLISRIRIDREEIAAGRLIQLSENVWMQLPAGTWYNRFWMGSIWAKAVWFLVVSYLVVVLSKIIASVLK